MELTNKQIIQIGLASEAFEKHVSEDKELLKKIPMKLRMKIKLNSDAVKDSFDFLRSEEKRVYKDYFGVEIGTLGWFYKESEEQVDLYKKNESAFISRLQKLIEEKEFEKLDKEFSKEFPVTDRTAENRSNASKEWKDLVEDENLTECNVREFSIDEFDLEGGSLPEVFISNYIASGLIK